MVIIWVVTIVEGLVLNCEVGLIGRQGWHRASGFRGLRLTISDGFSFDVQGVDGFCWFMDCIAGE